MERIFELDEESMLSNFGLEAIEEDRSMLQWSYLFVKDNICLYLTFCLSDNTISTVLYHKEEIIYSTFETNLVELKIRDNLIVGKTNKNGRSNLFRIDPINIKVSWESLLYES
jgi:hypothetical protein